MNKFQETPKQVFFVILIALLSALLIGCSGPQSADRDPELIEKIRSNIGMSGIEMDIYFQSGPAHNHPTFAVWVEDMEGNFVQTLYVTRSLASGIWGYGELSPGKWRPEPGYNVRPATLPYWLYRRGTVGELDLPSPENPVPDAITSATPRGDFVLETAAGVGTTEKFRLLVEINQTWDWNEYWTNNRFPENQDYKTSSQPAVVYAVTIDPASTVREYYLNPVGHSHYAGQDGRLYTDLSTLTTALQIVDKIVVTVR